MSACGLIGKTGKILGSADRNRLISSDIGDIISAKWKAGKKMEYKMNDERWAAIKAYLNAVWHDPKSYPDGGLLLSLSDEEIARVFTKERLRLIRLIQGKNPRNATELSNLARRRLSAVMRDLGLLEHFHIVALQKKGKNIVPKIEKEILIIPLVKLKAKTLPGIKAVA